MLSIDKKVAVSILEIPTQHGAIKHKTHTKQSFILDRDQLPFILTMTFFIV